MSAAPSLWLVGLNHRIAPVAVRERLAFRGEVLPEALRQLRSAAACHEAAILSTCNRVELYLVADHAESEMRRRVLSFLTEFHKLAEHDFAPSLYWMREAEAARHLFEVAASIDSQILGETEILSQTRGAFRAASEAGAAGPMLGAIFQRAFFLSKELRGQGGIGHARASVSFAAVKLAEKIFEKLKGRRVLVVGTGEMAGGILRTLKAGGVGDVVVLSRTLDRAEAFAAAEGGKAGTLDQLPEHLLWADIVLVSTAAPHYLIRPEMVGPVVAKRRGKPLFFIDISVPRNVDPAVNKLDDTFLYDIDDLESVADEGRRLRQEVAEHWRPRLADEAHTLLLRLKDCNTDQTARRLLEHANELRAAEVAALMKGLNLDEASAKKVAQALERFQGRLLHGPLSVLREAAREGDGIGAAQWIARFFHLQEKHGGGEGAPKDAPGEGAQNQA